MFFLQTQNDDISKGIQHLNKPESPMTPLRCQVLEAPPGTPQHNNSPEMTETHQTLASSQLPLTQGGRNIDPTSLCQKVE